MLLTRQTFNRNRYGRFFFVLAVSDVTSGFRTPQRPGKLIPLACLTRFDGTEPLGRATEALNFAGAVVREAGGLSFGFCEPAGTVILLAVLPGLEA